MTNEIHVNGLTIRTPGLTHVEVTETTEDFGAVHQPYLGGVGNAMGFTVEQSIANHGEAARSVKAAMHDSRSNIRYFRYTFYVFLSLMVLLAILGLATT
jgi:hypothetical protein